MRRSYWKRAITRNAGVPVERPFIFQRGPGGRDPGDPIFSIVCNLNVRWVDEGRVLGSRAIGTLF